MRQKVMVEMDVVTPEQLGNLTARVAFLESSAKKLQSLFNALFKDQETTETNVADHEREITLLRTSVQNIQKWIAERAVEKHASSAQPEDLPPNVGPAVARACPKGTTKVWLGLTKRQAEVLRIILGSIGGEHWSRTHTVSPAYKALAETQGDMGDIPGLGVKPSLVFDYWHGHYAPEDLREGLI